MEWLDAISEPFADIEDVAVSQEPDETKRSFSRGTKHVFVFVRGEVAEYQISERRGGPITGRLAGTGQTIRPQTIEIDASTVAEMIRIIATALDCTTSIADE